MIISKQMTPKEIYLKHGGNTLLQWIVRYQFSEEARRRFYSEMEDIDREYNASTLPYHNEKMKYVMRDTDKMVEASRAEQIAIMRAEGTRFAKMAAAYNKHFDICLKE